MKINSSYGSICLNVFNVHKYLGDPLFIDYTDGDIIFCDNIHDFPHIGSAQLDMTIIAYCLSGSMKIEINGEHFKLNANQMLFATSLSILSNHESSSDFECKIVVLSRQILSHMLYADKFTWTRLNYMEKHPITNLTPEDVRVFSNYYKLVNCLFSGKPGLYNNEAITAAFQSWMFYVVNIPDNEMEDASPIVQGDIIFKQFLELVSTDKGIHRDLAYYAEHLCITPRYLSLICKKYSKRNASEWIKEHTIEHIRYLLLNTNKTAQDICNEMKFPNLSFFGTYVKKNLGASPIKYRAKAKGKH